MAKTDLGKFIIPRKLSNTDENQQMGNADFDTTDYIWLPSDSEIEDLLYRQRQTTATDFSVANGLFVSWQGVAPTGKKGPTLYWLRSAYSLMRTDYVCIDGGRGSRYVGESQLGVRPALHLNLPSIISARSESRDFGKLGVVKDTNGNVLYHTIEFGEYPKHRAKNSDELENLHKNWVGRLKKTGKFYSGYLADDDKPAKHEEYEYRGERQSRARQRMNEMRRNQDPYYSGDTIDFGDIGTAKPILDWKKLLRREVEKEETIWSQRRGIAENNYAYRLEENEVEDEAETEVMIDVSGSVSLDMVKAFLRQLKPIVKQSKLKVGCFNEKYWGMVEIKTDKDIDRFKIPEEARGHSAWTEDWDLAVRSFSKKREVNKIVFTDGEPCPGTMPKKDLRGTNVIWLVYSNREFNPCCGTVIQISQKDLQSMQSLTVQDPEMTM